MTRYYVHHESGCVWSQEDDAAPTETNEIEAEEIDEGIFHSLIENGYQEYKL